MFNPSQSGETVKDRLSLALLQLEALLSGELDPIANLSNTSALVKVSLDRINWAGFYLFDGKELVLGPFQGLPACVRIPIGSGVCGKAAQTRKTIIVPDVHAFPGHIACDAASRSEIVVPLFRNGELYGVLDVDSPEVGRFGEDERAFLEGVAVIITKALP